jgi:hypothetical protein
MANVSVGDLKDVAGPRDPRVDRRGELLQIIPEALGRNRKQKRVEPRMVAAEAEARRARHQHPRLSANDVLEVLPMGVVGESGAETVKKVEVLARIHGQHQIGAAKARHNLLDGRGREEAVDLVEERAAAVLEHHPKLAHLGLLGREKLEVGRRNFSHRVHGMDSRKAEPTQTIHDERVGGANRIAIAR